MPERPAAVPTAAIRRLPATVTGYRLPVSQAVLGVTLLVRRKPGEGSPGGSARSPARSTATARRGSEA